MPRAGSFKATKQACWHCNVSEGDGAGAVKLLRCSQCKAAVYCSRACQKEDWKAHRAECRQMGLERAACCELSKAKEDNGNADRDSLASSILAEWNDQDCFIRYLDGNTLNCAITNLAPVSLAARRRRRRLESGLGHVPDAE